MFARVVINLAQINGVYDYHLPENLQDKVLPGCLVTVPLGGQVVQGVVLELSTESRVQNTRPVEALLDDLPVLTLAQLRLAQQLSEKTLSPLTTCIELMLPPGLSQHADTAYTIRAPQPAGQTEHPLSPLQQRLTKLLAERGEMRGRQFESALPRQNWKDAIQLLVRRGLVSARPVLPPPTVRPKYV
ncbi:MAG TPA: hypothetical protein VFF78_05870, partial [Anaerolineaceae bacterium]|nr:hypothetical protein [Anaerolineaceae bacterium]